MFLRWYRCAVIGMVALAASAVALSLLSSPERELPKDIFSYRASVEEGRYLANAGNCAACHTTETGQPYAGGVEFPTPFGMLYSTNITTDKETGIGSWSFEEFYTAMKQGVRPDGSHLYPAFPYTNFTRMTDEDIASLYLYLQTVEPVNAPPEVNALNFPYNQRFLLSAWKALFHTAETYVADPTRSAEWNRGAYLVEGPGHCGACHTPRNALGAERASQALTGGDYQDKVKFGYYREWSGVNLTPHPVGLATWGIDDIVDYLKDGVSGNAVVHGPMIDVVMNSTRHLTDADLRAMATYLKGIPANAQKPGPMPGKETMRAGEVIYTVHCGSCHLPTGKGDAGLGVPLAGNPTVQATNASSLINVILYGPHLPERLVVDRSGMKMFGKRLSDKDIANVASYVRSSFGNRAGRVTPEQVNRQR